MNDPPTIDELKRVFLAGDSRARTACVLVAHSGLRLQTLGDYQGRDGSAIDVPGTKINLPPTEVLDIENYLHGIDGVHMKSTVDVKPLKSFAHEKLPATSPLLSVLLLEQDELPIRARFDLSLGNVWEIDEIYLQIGRKRFPLIVVKDLKTCFIVAARLAKSATIAAITEVLFCA